jgi:hypothetical protein
MDQNILNPLSMAILVTGCGFSQVDEKIINLLVRSKLGFEEGV